MSDRYSKILDQFNKDRNTIAFYKTQGFKKLWRYIGVFVKTEPFLAKINTLRKKYKIPPEGFIVKESPWIHPPKEWKFYSPDLFIRLRIMSKVRDDLRQICDMAEVDAKDFVDIFESYLFYNKLMLSMNPNSHNLLYVTDLSTKFDSLGRELTDADIKVFPVALLISPYASKRDILNYLAKIYSTEIEPLQLKYRKPESKVGKFKKSNNVIQKRNDMIYSYRELTYKRIVSIVNKHFPKNTVDEGGVGKIISLEKERRN